MATALLVPVASATPPAPEPRTAASVQQRLTSLAHKNSQLDEQVNKARVDFAAKQKAAAKARAAAAVAAAEYARARAALSATVAAQYEGGSFSSTGALLSSDSGQGYLDELQTLSMLSTHASQVTHSTATARAAADSSAKRAAALLKEAAAHRDAVQKRKAALSKEIDKYRTLLASLTARERAAYARTISPSVSDATLSVAAAKVASGAASGAAKKAVEFALAQVGKPYVWGAAGPGAYDCSGLTSAAYAAAGVSLPHSAADQYNYGTPVSIENLQPGDLLFYYSPIGHVAMAVGGGMMVHASTEGVPIAVVPINYMNGFVGAKRIVG